MKKVKKKAIIQGKNSITQPATTEADQANGGEQANHNLVAHSAGLNTETVHEAVAAYLDFLSKRGIHKPHLMDMKAVLSKFAGEFGDTQIQKVTTSDIQEWLESNWQNGSKRVRLICIISRLFEHAQAHLKAENLVCKLHTKPEAEVLTIEEVTKLLSELHDLETTLAVVLVLFGYMREQEVLKSEFRHFSLAQSSIYLPVNWLECRKDQAKSRIIPMSPNLRSMLEVILPTAESATKGGMIFRKGVFERVRRVAQATGIEWTRNALRRSCSSYAVCSGEPLAEVAGLYGHTIKLFNKHFWVPVAASDAKSYWEICLDFERLKALPWHSRKRRA